MSFVRDQWYVAAYSAEVGRALLARTILGEPLVLYRTSAGQPAALVDRCVHRHFPLSAGQLDGDTIVCGYHGFTYGPDGRCVAVPGQQRIPRTARVTAYPVAEQDSLVWVWIGDPERADAGFIPRAPVAGRPGVHHRPRHGAAGGPVRAAGGQPVGPVARDLPARWVHRHPRGCGHPDQHRDRPGAARHPGEPPDGRRRVPAVLREVHRASAGASCAGRTSSTTRRAYTCCTAGWPRSASCPGRTAPTPTASMSRSVYAITPSTETSTYDFWAVARDFALGDAEISAFLHDSNRTGQGR